MEGWAGFKPAGRPPGWNTIPVDGAEIALDMRGFPLQLPAVDRTRTVPATP